RDRQLVVRRQIEEALDARRRMVGALALVPVWKQQDDAGLLVPLGLAGRDVLVDDRLGTVDEVAELRLPHRQRLGASHGVAVLEAEGRVLREQRVVDVERCLVVREVRQRSPLAGGLAIDVRRESLVERAAARVLAGEAYRPSDEEPRPDRPYLASRRVDPDLLHVGP